MKYYAYMLESRDKKGITYVGWTNNLKKRIKIHNAGKGAKFTKGRKWKVIYYEIFNRQGLYTIYNITHEVHYRLDNKPFCINVEDPNHDDYNPHEFN